MSYQLTWLDFEDRWMPNCIFSIWNSESRYEFCLYTVQSGVLKDHRIFKYKVPGSNSYKGFAFLMSDVPHIKVWNSQRNIVDPIAVDLCKAFVSVANNGDYIYVNGRSWQFAKESRCARCNTYIPFGDHWCNEHRFAIEQYRDDILREEQIARYDQRRARRAASAAPGSSIHSFVRAATDAEIATQRHAIQEQTVASDQPIRSVPLSENGTGLIR